uniref:PH domain-containing protein n=1 Tax=Timspurckia oligopyrenoides TaxID=708627 RepID=A0A7S0ZG92_9RHOD|mmetsp:Transcript_4055/g.7108  ORF Transcript_4055/g.7108 Transcript_4055/m.7108 type:complete len:144 (+) Transcript_4055:58-489(+)|eukprot:CAMPEP_0182452610 /NCGR_PEP_ID=MMETSP1172-20130603/44342_1 /TAXON_ID=708627 /ORGANISM="Timspurckia oligopyrenoides, Strain CCMP3278" /LENGTH=143 /DNA_ID=CAMNT_0024650453 /DNA_START=480 /DNA_END=911 /DNA_ORIENTATION=+
MEGRVEMQSECVSYCFVNRYLKLNNRKLEIYFNPTDPIPATEFNFDTVSELHIDDDLNVIEIGKCWFKVDDQMEFQKWCECLKQHKGIKESESNESLNILIPNVSQCSSVSDEDENESDEYKMETKSKPIPQISVSDKTLVSH